MIECKGRNGWFRFGAFRMMNLGNGSINLEILSTREPRDIGPICFQGPKAEVLDLFAALQKHIAQEAYARFIIEAAPDLLGACEAVLKGEGTDDEILNQVATAVAKAKRGNLEGLNQKPETED